MVRLTFYYRLLCFAALFAACGDDGPAKPMGDSSTCVPKAELCNQVDDDCDGQVDEGLAEPDAQTGSWQAITSASDDILNKPVPGYFYVDAEGRIYAAVAGSIKRWQENAWVDVTSSALVVGRFEFESEKNIVVAHGGSKELLGWSGTTWLPFGLSSFEAWFYFRSEQDIWTTGANGAAMYRWNGTQFREVSCKSIDGIDVMHTKVTLNNRFFHLTQTNKVYAFATRIGNTDLGLVEMTPIEEYNTSVDDFFYGGACRTVRAPSEPAVKVFAYDIADDKTLYYIGASDDVIYREDLSTHTRAAATKALAGMTYFQRACDKIYALDGSGSIQVFK